MVKRISLILLCIYLPLFSFSPYSSLVSEIKSNLDDTQLHKPEHPTWFVGPEVHSPIVSNGNAPSSLAAVDTNELCFDSLIDNSTQSTSTPKDSGPGLWTVSTTCVVISVILTQIILKLTSRPSEPTPPYRTTAQEPRITPVVRPPRPQPQRNTQPIPGSRELLAINAMIDTLNRREFGSTTPPFLQRIYFDEIVTTNSQRIWVFTQPWPIQERIYINAITHRQLTSDEFAELQRADRTEQPPVIPNDYIPPPPRREPFFSYTRGLLSTAVQSALQDCSSGNCLICLEEAQPLLPVFITCACKNMCPPCALSTARSSFPRCPICRSGGQATFNMPLLNWATSNAGKRQIAERLQELQAQ